jgi:uncharacterized damage-inducible protein DinB
MTFDPEVFSEHFQFIAWGDQQLLAAAAKIPEAEYLAERGISAGSLHKLLVHMLAAEWVWVARWLGEASPRFETDQDHPTLESLAKRWTVVHEQITTFLKKQTSASLNAVFSYNDSRGTPHALPLGVFVQHMLDHGTYHRGQANTLIKLCGGKPVTLPLYAYFEMRSK